MMNELPDSIHYLISVIDYIALNSTTIIWYIPKVIQTIGMVGWIWEGYHLYRDRRWKNRASGFTRATITFAFGKLLDILLTKISFI